MPEVSQFLQAGLIDSDPLNGAPSNLSTNMQIFQTTMYIKYSNRGEDICIGVFRDLKIAVGVCSGTDG
jgi:hypothetical protein